MYIPIVLSTAITALLPNATPFSRPNITNLPIRLTKMAFPIPNGISTYHTTTYPTISIKRPELSTAGKVVLITGGGSGLGLEFAQHFVLSGCTSLAITGRRSPILDSAQKTLQESQPNVKVLTLQCDVTDRSGMRTAFTKTREAFGNIDILINNAGYLPSYEPLGAETNAEDWWQAFETNVGGSHNVLAAFLPVAAPDAIVINLTSGAVNAIIPGQSAYTASKIASTRLFECFQMENPGFRVVNVAPGVVLTEMHKKSVEHFEEKGWAQLPLDDSKLCPSCTG
jgi:NAD(P)-dependent dehydrogenase (short-subunit alcohol dehydrogenase family)